MKWGDKEILGVLDACASSFNFPAMDNGYVYPAASKLSVYRSEEDWAFVIAVSYTHLTLPTICSV